MEKYLGFIWLLLSVKIWIIFYVSALWMWWLGLCKCGRRVDPYDRSKLQKAQCVWSGYWPMDVHHWGDTDQFKHISFSSASLHSFFVFDNAFRIRFFHLVDLNNSYLVDHLQFSNRIFALHLNWVEILFAKSIQQRNGRHDAESSPKKPINTYLAFSFRNAVDNIRSGWL